MLGGGGIALEDVTPPRASQRQTAWRKIGYVWNEHWASFRERLPSGRISIGLASELAATDVPFWTLAIPGLPQRWLGFPIRAGVFFWLWLPLFAYGVFGVGLPLSATAMGFAFSVHASSVLDLYVAEVDNMVRRVLAIFVTMFAVALLFYYPCYRLISLVALPIQVRGHYGPFEAGDTALVLPSSYAVGDVVAVVGNRSLFWGPTTDLATVIGLEGDEVAGDGKSVQVNGTPIRFFAVDQIATLGPAFKQAVPNGEVLVVLSEQRRINGRLQQGSYALRSMAASDVFGRAAYIAGPWSRRGWVRRMEGIR